MYKLGGAVIKLGWVFIEVGERIEFKCYPHDADDPCTVYDLDEAEENWGDSDPAEPTENPGDDEEAQDYDDSPTDE